jgi:hypothetical protein
MGEILDVNGDRVQLEDGTIAAQMDVEDMVTLLMAVEYVLEDLSETPDEQFDDEAKFAFESLITVKSKMENMMGLDAGMELH